jgi:hypothetical protein
MVRGVGRLGLVGMLSTGMLTSGVAEASAQERYGPGGAVYVNFVVADAIGDLGWAVDQGYGLELGAGLPIAADGHLRLRFDGGFSIYGLERIHYCDFGCRVGSTVTTANSIFYGGVGPEIVFGAGDIRPYVHGSAGLSWFVTSSSLDHHDGYGPYLDTTNYSDTVFSWRVGGGLRFGVGSGPVFIDLGATLHENQFATYLTNGDIVDNPDGTITMHPKYSDADLLSFKMGVSVAIH